jgi:hypothetical protein
LQQGSNTRLNETFYRHTRQMNSELKAIYSECPSEQQKEQRAFVLRHLVFQHCPELLADHVLGDNTTSVVREEHVKKLLFDGIKAVLALVAAGAKGGRPTNEHLPIGRILLGSACLYLKKGQYADAARLLDTTRRAIAANTAVAVDNLNAEGLAIELREGFLKVRGLERSKGLFCKTPAAIIEQITQYYTLASVACPGKYDVVTNPEKRRESERKRLLFGNIHKHHRKCLALAQEEQLSQWEQAMLLAPDEAFDTTKIYAVSTRLHSRGDHRMLLVRMVTGRVRELQGNDGDTVLCVQHKRSTPRHEQRKRAYEASLVARGKNPFFEERYVQETKVGVTMVVEAIVQLRD